MSLVGALARCVIFRHSMVNIWREDTLSLYYRYHHSTKDCNYQYHNLNHYCNYNHQRHDFTLDFITNVMIACFHSESVGSNCRLQLLTHNSATNTTTFTSAGRVEESIYVCVVGGDRSVSTIYHLRSVFVFNVSNWDCICLFYCERYCWKCWSR